MSRRLSPVEGKRDELTGAPACYGRSVAQVEWGAPICGATTVEVREHESGAHLMESEIYLRDGSSKTEDTKSAGPSPLRLRVGVFLILLWVLPFWALAPYIANSLSGLSNTPSVAAVTTIIVVVQTILGLLGFWVAGAAVKSIIKGSTMRHALGPSGPC